MSSVRRCLSSHRKCYGSFNWLSVVSYFLVFLLVFSMSATVDINSIACRLKNRAGILTRVSLQFGVLTLFSDNSEVDAKLDLEATVLSLWSGTSGFLGVIFSNAISIYAKLLDPERV